MILLLSVYFIGFLGLPKGSGKIKDISKFDAEFFGISEKETNLIDAQIRIMLELTYEAIWDSGNSITLVYLNVFYKFINFLTILQKIEQTVEQSHLNK